MVALSRQYAKLCDVRDFDDPDLIAKIHEVDGRSQASPADRHRKAWEYAMLALYLEEAGALGEDTDVLAVAAGHEPPLYWLANRCRSVLATDVYGAGAFAGQEADARMLENPAAFAPFAYREDRLEARSMDARAIDAPDASFDIVTCLSSIEHFGTPAEIRRSAAEMARVLRPGGRLVITTELILRKHPMDWPPLQALLKTMSGGRICADASLSARQNDGFWLSELQRDVIDPTGLALAQPLHTALSEASFEHVVRQDRHGRTWTRDGDPFPHVVLRAYGAPWTSVFLPLAESG